MSRMRLRIAERLKQSQNAAASLTTFNEIDMSSLIDMRSRYKDAVLKEHDIKLGFMSAFARASVLALKEVPAANASIEGDEIVYRDYVDLSVAVATPKGLVTPVVRNAEGMNFIEIEKEIAALGKKVRVPLWRIGFACISGVMVFLTAALFFLLGQGWQIGS
jgi:2-oxoglutarate dehydrogenase E2 component (dihydrolipoamide succinyltransferase)